MQNYQQTIVSQYGNSPILKAFIQSFDDCIAPDADIDNFYSYVWDVDTAQGFGLDILGRIVGVTRVLNVQPTSTYLGFEEGQSLAAADYQSFNHGIFYTGPATSSQVLSDSAFRVLILVKALSNISDGSVYSYNKLLRILFNQKVYCVEIGPLQVQYVFETPLQPYEVAILANNNVIPRPAGVIITLA